MIVLPLNLYVNTLVEICHIYNLDMKFSYISEKIKKPEWIHSIPGFDVCYMASVSTAAKSTTCAMTTQFAANSFPCHSK